MVSFKKLGCLNIKPFFLIPIRTYNSIHFHMGLYNFHNKFSICRVCNITLVFCLRNDFLKWIIKLFLTKKLKYNTLQFNLRLAQMTTMLWPNGKVEYDRKMIKFDLLKPKGADDWIIMRGPCRIVKVRAMSQINEHLPFRSAYSAKGPGFKTKWRMKICLCTCLFIRSVKASK